MALAAGWPVALVVAIYAAAGRNGFNPTDQGWVLAQSYRIRMGQIPHVDFLSQKPVGSGYLHLVDLFMPGPLVEVSAFISLVVLAAATILLAMLIFDRPPATWSLLEAAGVATSLLVNLHTFPLMAWPTTDGILLVAAGLVLVRRGARSGPPWLWLLGFLLLGAAAVTKQSFVPAPALGVMLVAAVRPRLPKTVARDAALGIAASALPAALYVGWVGAAGGLSEFRTQLLSAAPPSVGRNILAVFSESLGVEMAIGIGLAIIVATLLRRTTRSTSTVAAIVALVLRVTLTGYVAWILFNGGLAYGQVWGTAILWMLVIFLLQRLDSDLDPLAWSVVGVAGMTMVSIGNPNPDLVSGSLLLLLGDRLWRGVRVPKVPPRVGSLGLGAVALAGYLAVAGLFLDARRHNVYRDLPSHELTASLGGVAPGFGGIQTNKLTAQYMQQIATCVRNHPAHWVAVIPDNPIIYPVLGLHNPLPLDWLYPVEVGSSQDRIVRAAQSLDARGDYLVMIQTVRVDGITSYGALPSATWQGSFFEYAPRPEGEVVASLHGLRTTCGSFLAVYDQRLVPGT